MAETRQSQRRRTPLNAVYTTRTMATQHFVRRTTRQVKTIDRLVLVDEPNRFESDFESEDSSDNAISSKNGSVASVVSRGPVESAANASEKPTSTRSHGKKESSRAAEWDAVMEKTWEDKYQELCQYKAEHGTCIMSVEDFEPNRALGRWLRTQRKQRAWMKEKRPDRVVKLDKVSFPWNVRDAEWEELFHELESFKAEHGHCNVPCAYPPHLAFGRWVNAQRSAYRNRNEVAMRPDRIQRLTNLGFIWKGRPFKNPNGQKKPKRTSKGSDKDNGQCVHDKNWEVKFKQLKEYRAEHGNCTVPENYELNLPLGRWVGWQRKQRFDMGPGRLKKLEGLGFVWSPRQTQWEQRFKELESFKAAYGHCNVSRNSNHQYSMLGRWVLCQRDAYKNRHETVMAPHRIRRLENLGFMWVDQYVASKKRKGKRTLQDSDSEDCGDDDEGIEDSDQKPPARKSPPVRGVASKRKRTDKAESSAAKAKSTEPDLLSGMRKILLVNLSAYRDGLVKSLTPESSTHYWNVHQVVQDLEGTPPSEDELDEEF